MTPYKGLMKGKCLNTPYSRGLNRVGALRLAVMLWPFYGQQLIYMVT